MSQAASQVIMKTLERGSAAWTAIYRCWYSPSIYQEAAHLWRGLGYLYLVILLVCLWAIVSVHVHFVVRDYVEGYLKPVVKSMPTIQMKDGLLSVDRNEKTFMVSDPRNGKALLYFDLADPPRKFKSSEDGVFVERKRVIFHWRGDEKVYDFDKKSTSACDLGWIAKGLAVMEEWVGVLVFGVFWLSSFILVALQVLVYGLVGKAVARLSRTRLTYPQLVRISTIAVTPSLIIDTCQKLVCVGIPGWTTVSVLICLSYLVFGVRGNCGALAWSMMQDPSQPNTFEGN